LQKKISTVKHLYTSFEFQQQRLAFAVQRFASRYFDPTFADAVFLDIVAFFVVEANADVVVKWSGSAGRAGVSLMVGSVK